MNLSSPLTVGTVNGELIRVVTRHDPNNGCEGDYIDRTHWKGFEESSENFRDYSALPKLLS